MKPERAILVLNAGSSNLKVALMVRRGGAIHRLDGASRTGAPDVQDLLAWARDCAEIAAVGHRVVHGGSRFSGPERVTDLVIQEVEALTPLAPLHQPQSLALIKAVAGVAPGLPQTVSFDTAFHRGHVPAVDRLAIPREWEERGIKRYGFHGLSYQYLCRRLAELDSKLGRGRVILAHLGAGASLCAVHEGRSVDTTMGFSTLDGLVMATRPGTLDPGALLHLIRRESLTPEAVEDMLYRRSGLLGLSGISDDMKTLLESGRPEAEAALEVYVLQLVRQIGALTSVLGGVDGFVFSGGVGEHAPEIRRRVCDRLAWLGVRLDSGANLYNAPMVSRPDSLPVHVIPADEEHTIAAEAFALLRGG